MLELEEKCAGRLFRDLASKALDEINANDPPDFAMLPVIGIYRHACAAKDGVSTAMDLKEVWVSSPRIVVERADDNTLTAYEYSTWIPKDIDTWTVPEGRFGFVTREGRCRFCGKTARSTVGRVVDAFNRPPMQGRMVP